MTTEVRQLLKKVQSLERSLAKEKGSFTFFALLLREGSPDRWDLVASAPWFPADPIKGRRFLATTVQTRLPLTKLILISRVMAVDLDDPALHEAQGMVSDVEHGAVEVRDTEMFGRDIRHGYIVTSLRATPARLRRAR